ncbi:PadR family transcriptional regulator [Anatilimnocola floriformis]|uniref:PadR family transcriptional regulator n=1 Tax=Anatilimnocola floriformis TaxID=2948575 RepID=UPI0020C2E3DC|nr:helix-turn-helix transcriptional regulator [Anatilimnocola floriformis]
MAEKPGLDKFERDLLRGSLDLMLLSVLASGKKYGYLLQKQVRDASGGRVEIAAGTLYPLLHRLEEDKLIRSSWDDDTGRRRKWYELTAAGHRRLKTQAQEWLDYAACVRELLQLASIMPRSSLEF